MKITIFSNIPAPYFVGYLNELGKYATVKAFFERQTASDRDKSWDSIGAVNFRYVIFDGIKIGPESALTMKVISAIKDNIDSILIFANPTTPTGIIGINYCKRHQIAYMLQSEGGLPKSGKGLKEIIKRKLIKGASLYLTGMRPKDDYFYAYGAPIERIRQYPFASLAEKDLINAIPTNEQKQILRNELGIQQEKMVLYVGRMLHVKGVDVLIKACQGMDDNIGVYLVGGSETEQYRSLKEQYGITNLHYVSHLGLERLKKYYLAADILVLPTRSDTWGLVINEAMSFGLPIITTENCVAGTQLIENGEGGFIVRSEASDELHERIVYLLNNQDTCKTMGSINFEKIRGHTYENMAKVIFNYLSLFANSD